eukprot:TRINITY_DN1326_c0_g1_i3.p1 TRINITY_DN1326_c0_g1~~TRINITY_DN1326_c0_g1_i3.p1  ORF type:complete len:398 (+),score=29.29 TRINITY_DN1326_c0_g1_i3:828-2021(+)
MHYIYQFILYAGNTFCWGMLYYFTIDQLLEGFLFSWVTVFFLPLYSRYGILSFLASIIYIIFFFIFYLHIYIMISVCTKIENKFEKEVENKTNTLIKENSQIFEISNYNLTDKQRNIIKPFFNFLNNIADFYEPIFDIDKERIFLTKHQILFANYKKKFFFQRYFLLIELGRIFILTFNIVVFYRTPIVQSILNFMTLAIYDYFLAFYLPNVTWYTNIFLIINESCILIMFLTTILFAILDKLQNEDLDLRWKIGQVFAYCSIIIMFSSLGAMGASMIRMIINFSRFLYTKFQQLIKKKPQNKLKTVKANNNFTKVFTTKSQLPSRANNNFFSDLNIQSSESYLRKNKLSLFANEQKSAVIKLSDKIKDSLKKANIQVENQTDYFQVEQLENSIVLD